jgi:hypothetical protein
METNDMSTTPLSRFQLLVVIAIFLYLAFS